MFQFRIRALRFTDRLALCAIAVPLLILYARWAHADNPCPKNKEASVPCVPSGYQDCEKAGYDTKEKCEGKWMTEIYTGNFNCESNGTNLTMCVPLTDGGKLVLGDCTKEYYCEWGNGCIKGQQKGNTVGQALYTNKDCKK